ncbi:MAG: AAA family ATPase [Candidatus Methylumidiphilus sp.]
MLLRFTIENLFCFAGETVFSMVAGKDEEHSEHKCHLRDSYEHEALCAAALYGANAHGKTKLVEAIAFARNLILEGRRPGQSIPVSTFRLDAEKLGQPSYCEFVIFHLGVEYTYGFLANNTRIEEEWLFARPDGEEVRYFERLTDNQGHTQIEFGSALSSLESEDNKFIEYVAKGTRDNQLFLTEAIERNIEVLKPIYSWFLNTLTIVPTNREIESLVIRAYEDSDFRNFISSFLKLANTGIDTISIEEKSLNFDKLLISKRSKYAFASEEFIKEFENDIADGLASQIESEGRKLSEAVRPSVNGQMLICLKTVHNDNQGNAVPFDIDEESSGTQRIMQILPVLADMRETSKVYVVDELDRMLHPLLSRLFLETFLKLNKNNKNQLIFTTHETSLLNLDLLRRDEIWFVEKARSGSSQLYSLADFEFKPNPAIKLERGYLQGRFGGIPFIGDIRSLGW